MTHCKKSPNGIHAWIYPRQEESIDRNRPQLFPYCMHCLKSEPHVKELFFTELVSIGISADETLLTTILSMQNPEKARRGGMGLGIFANVSLLGESANINMRINADSMYRLVRDVESAQYCITYNCSRIARVILSKSTWTNTILSTGRRISEVIQQHTPNNLVGIIGPIRCSLFDGGNACSFCQLDGRTGTNTIQTEEYIEAIRVALETKKSYRLTFTSGLLTDSQFRAVCDQLRHIKNAFPGLAIGFECQPLLPMQIPLIYESGIDTLMIPLDCYSEAAQHRHLPGKAELLKTWYWNTTLLAVQYFGPGNVTSNLIVGLEPIHETKLAIQKMVFYGIIPELIPLRPHENPNLQSADPVEMIALRSFLIQTMKLSGLATDAAKIKSGCAACGGCNAGFTANMIIE